MFTGFASENTPAIQVWDFATANKATTSISLTDDCAPIQVVVCGNSTNTILLYLPSSPIEGKQIKIINSLFGSSASKISIRSADISEYATTAELLSLGVGQTIDLCYSKNFISRSSSSFRTGWISLNQAFTAASNANAISFGSSNIASGSNSATIGGSNNAANENSAAVVGGSNNIINGSSSVIIGGTSNVANGQLSAIAGGTSNATTANNSAVVGGNSNFATAVNSFVGGGRGGSVRSIVGNTIFPASDIPISTTLGCTQTALLVLGRETTNATATVLTSNTSAAGTTNQVILPNNSAYYFKGSITAGVTGAGNSAMWSFEGGIKRGVGTGTTVLVGTPVLNVVARDSGASTWTVALTADTTNGGLAVTVTGQASTTIRWVCKVETTEMTF